MSSVSLCASIICRMDEKEEIMKGLKHFLYKGHEVVVFHILDPREITFDFNERVRFKDIVAFALTKSITTKTLSINL